MRSLLALVVACACRRACAIVVSGAGPAAQQLPAATSRVSLLTSTPDELRDQFGWPKLNHAASDKGDGVWSLIRKGIDPRAEDEAHLWNPNLISPKLRRLLEDECSPICAGMQTDSSIASDGTQKLLLRLEDELAVECVIIPMLGGRTTSLCISSQVGCSRGCTFCSTGAMGLLRNLRAEEILSQVWLAQRVIRKAKLPPLVNIVFMGMGEPLNNLEQVCCSVTGEGGERGRRD